MKKLLILMLSLLMAVLMLVACGKNKAEEKDDDEKTSETTAVLETTADGGTVEQDAEGNIVTKGADGKVIHVEDKDGNSVDVSEYVQTHSWIEQSGDSVSKDEEPTQAINPTDSEGNEMEGEIPAVISTAIPEDEVTEFPDL